MSPMLWKKLFKYFLTLENDLIMSIIRLGSFHFATKNTVSCCSKLFQVEKQTNAVKSKQPPHPNKHHKPVLCNPLSNTNTTKNVIRSIRWSSLSMHACLLYKYDESQQIPNQPAVYVY